MEDVAFEDLTNSRMNNMAIKVDQQQSLQVDHTHTTSRFLSLPKISSTKVKKGNHPYIDYIKSFIMTSTKYISALEEKGKQKYEVNVEWEGRKTKKEARNKQEHNKRLHNLLKHQRLKKENEQWSFKFFRTIREKLHAIIKVNTLIDLEGYIIPYYGFAP